MAIPSGGVVPGAGSVYNELTAVTRRAFIPKLTANLYYATPSMSLLLGNAQKSAGGLAQITAPVQGASMVQGAWTSYSGSFNKPAVIPGIQDAAWNTSYYVVPIPLVLGEALLQSTEAVIPIIDARMNDVKAVTAQQMGSALFTNNSTNNLMPSSFVDAFDSGANAPTYGGISRTAANNAFWKGQTYTGLASAVATRAGVAQYTVQITDVAGGEAPDFGVMSPSDFATLQKDFIGTENTYIVPGQRFAMDTPVRSGFPALVINGIPHFMDHFCPKGTMYYVNSKYTSMYISEDAFFAFSGFYSLIPLQQIGQVGVMILGYNIVTTKPSSGAALTGITSGAF
jgi:hypothetical protein